MPDEAQKTIFDKDKPIAQADFFYSNKKIIVFIDGHPHSLDYVHKMDEEKRKVLKGMSFIIHSINGLTIDSDLEKLEQILTI